MTPKPDAAAVEHLRQIPRVSVGDAIVEQIMALIESGELTPGQRLPSEKELCTRFGAGRSSLREALRCLAMVGVLHARTGEGTSVAPDSSKLLGRIVRWRLVTEQQDLENLMEVRIALEGLSVRSFALHASDADIRHLEGLHGEMAAALQREDARGFLAIDLDFHLFIGRASGNSLLYDLILTIRGQLAEGLKRVLARQSTLPVALKEHGLILETVRQRDPDGAQAAMNVHLYGGLERYRKMHKADRDGMKPVPRKKKTQTSAQ